MKSCTKCAEVKPLADFSKNKAAKDGLYARCKACVSLRMRAYTALVKQDRGDEKAAYAKAYRIVNRQALDAKKAEYIARNIEAVTARRRAYYQANKDRFAERSVGRYWSMSAEEKAEWIRQAIAWRKSHPEVGYEANARRRAAKERRTPAWVDLGAIKEIYKLAAKVRKAGVNAHVDHIYPLRGKTVSGLHVPENLQIVLAGYNQSKNNKFPDIEAGIEARQEVSVALCTPVRKYVL